MFGRPRDPDSPNGGGGQHRERWLKPRGTVSSSAASSAKGACALVCRAHVGPSRARARARAGGRGRRDGPGRPPPRADSLRRQIVRERSKTHVHGRSAVVLVVSSGLTAKRRLERRPNGNRAAPMALAVSTGRQHGAAGLRPCTSPHEGARVLESGDAVVCPHGLAPPCTAPLRQNTAPPIGPSVGISSRVSGTQHRCCRKGCIRTRRVGVLPFKFSPPNFAPRVPWKAGNPIKPTPQERLGHVGLCCMHACAFFSGRALVTHTPCNH